MVHTKSKKNALIKLAVLVSFIFISAFFILNKKEKLVEVEVSANEIMFDTPEQLSEFSDLIIVASPSKDFLDRKHVTTYFEDGTIEDFYTLTEVQIEKIMKAPSNFKIKKDDVISVIEPVGIVDRKGIGKRKLVVNQYKEVKKQSAYILFLKQNQAGQYALINNNLGKINIDHTDTLDLGEKKSKEDIEFKKDVITKFSLD